MTSPLPRNAMDELEKRAAEQRQRLHDDVIELRKTVRERLDIQRNVRNHVALVTAAMAVLGLALGYLAAGAFSRGNRR